MSKHHDENKDLRLISRIAKIDFANKTITAKGNVTIGIKTWGRIDYLTKYCGWFFYYNRTILHTDADGISYFETKKEAKKNLRTSNNRRHD